MCRSLKWNLLRRSQHDDERMEPERQEWRGCGWGGERMQTGGCGIILSGVVQLGLGMRRNHSRNLTWNVLSSYWRMLLIELKLKQIQFSQLTELAPNCVKLSNFRRLRDSSSKSILLPDFKTIKQNNERILTGSQSHTYLDNEQTGLWPPQNTWGFSHWDGARQLLRELSYPTQTHTHTHWTQCDNEEMIKSSIKLNECEGTQLEGPDPGQSGRDEMMQGAKQDAIH